MNKHELLALADSLARDSETATDRAALVTILRKLAVLVPVKWRVDSSGKQDSDRLYKLTGIIDHE